MKREYLIVREDGKFYGWTRTWVSEYADAKKFADEHAAMRIYCLLTQTERMKMSVPSTSDYQEGRIS